MSFLPHSAAQPLDSFVTLEGDDAILLTALKPAEDGDGMIARLFNPTNQDRQAVLTLAGVPITVDFAPFELRTLLLSQMEWQETNLVEMPR